MEKKNMLRIGTLMIIFMFLIVPLLSMPIAASFTQNVGTVWTNNTPGGPTAGGTPNTPASPVGDNSPYSIRLSVGYTYTDSDPNGAGSNHWMVIWVRWRPGGPPAGWSTPEIHTQSWILLGGPGVRTGTYTTPWVPAGGGSYGGGGTNFRVTVTVYCQTVGPPSTASWATSPWITFTI